MSVVGMFPPRLDVPDIRHPGASVCVLPANTSVLLLGVDFGTLNTVIAVARNRGVDVVRHTPPLLVHSLLVRPHQQG